VVVRILLTGVSGFAGSALLPRLLDDGHEIRVFARDRGRVEQALSFSGRATLADFELTLGDALAGTNLNRAMRGIEVAYYLIHSMEPTHDRGSPRHTVSSRSIVVESPSNVSAFPERERIAAMAFSSAARVARVGRIVYLGGLLPAGEHQTPSSPLSSRYAVERILLDALPDSVALRASIVIGARSRSFRFLVRLVERLPVLLLPAWRRFSTRPIDERDIVEMLVACATASAVTGRSLDVGGPEVLTYGRLMERIAELMLLGRPTIGLDLTVTPIAARLAAVLTNETPELLLPLMEGLNGDLLPADDHTADILNVELHSFDAAVEHALHEWEKVEPLAAR
jgi:uncharacterized protein YbjT (DUF2867 family)